MNRPFHIVRTRTGDQLHARYVSEIDGKPWMRPHTSCGCRVATTCRGKIKARPGLFCEKCFSLPSAAGEYIDAEIVL